MVDTLKQDPMTFDQDLDVRGLNCPLPLLRLKQFLPKVDVGQVIRVSATDPAAHLDIGVFVDRSPHEMLHYRQVEGVQQFYIQKNADS